MNKQKGYLNIDVITPLIVFGVFIGFVLSVAVPWLWSFIKPFIHAITG